jgi:hypothetical protein
MPGNSSFSGPSQKSPKSFGARRASPLETLRTSRIFPPDPPRLGRADDDAGRDGDPILMVDSYCFPFIANDRGRLEAREKHSSSPPLSPAPFSGAGSNPISRAPPCTPLLTRTRVIQFRRGRSGRDSSRLCRSPSAFAPSASNTPMHPRTMSGPCANLRACHPLPGLPALAGKPQFPPAITAPRHPLSFLPDRSAARISLGAPLRTRRHHYGLQSPPYPACSRGASAPNPRAFSRSSPLCARNPRPSPPISPQNPK